MPTFNVIRIELGVIDAETIEQAHKKLQENYFNVGHSSEDIFPQDDKLAANFTIDSYKELTNNYELLITELKVRMQEAEKSIRERANIINNHDVDSFDMERWDEIDYNPYTDFDDCQNHAWDVSQYTNCKRILERIGL
jgi:hypothetical protein